VKNYEFDLKKARDLLTKAGFPNGFDLELWTGRDRTIVEAIAQMWGRAGVRVRIRNVPNAALTKALQEKQVAAYFTTYGSFGIPDAGALMPDRLGRGYNSAMHGNVELEEAILAAQGTFDQNARKTHFRRAVEIMADNAYWVPVFEYTQNFLMSPELAYEQSPDGMPRLFLARWK
jgi:peptide/nickel transport system substrate-binding protein